MADLIHQKFYVITRLQHSFVFHNDQIECLRIVTSGRRSKVPS